MDQNAVGWGMTVLISLIGGLGTAFGVLWKKINDLMISHAKCQEDHADCREKVATLSGEILTLKDHNSVQDKWIADLRRDEVVSRTVGKVQEARIDNLSRQSGAKETDQVHRPQKEQP